MIVTGSTAEDTQTFVRYRLSPYNARGYGRRMDTTPETHQKRPLVGVSVLVRRGGDVLLVKRGRPPFMGQWALPGGRVELGERLEEAAIREIREETGIEIERLSRIDLAEIIGRDDTGAIESHIVLIVYEGHFRAGTLAAGDDAAEASWMPPANLSRLMLTEDTRRVLAAHEASR